MSVHTATVPAEPCLALSGDAADAGRGSPNRATYAVGPAPTPHDPFRTITPAPPTDAERQLVERMRRDLARHVERRNRLDRERAAQLALYAR